MGWWSFGRGSGFVSEDGGMSGGMEGGSVCLWLRCAGLCLLLRRQLLPS